MEAKKNPDKDVYRKSPQFFLLGLMVSVALVITAFEWSTPKSQTKPPRKEEPEIGILLDDFSVITHQDEIKPPPIETKIKPKEIVPEIIFEQTEGEPEAEEIIFTDNPETNGTGSSAPISLEAEEVDPIVVFPEKAAAPINGYDGFYQMVRKNLKYPKQALMQDVKGRVYVEFVINTSGEPMDIRISRGIGAGCDEEAKRVISLSRWEPAKQRGKPVRTRMVMPIIFAIQN